MIGYQFGTKFNLVFCAKSSLIGSLFQRAADAFLSQGKFKPSSSDSADRGRSIIRVIK
jgi:hypothetical protein